MASFLYFRENDTRPLNREQIEELGLGYAFAADAEIESREIRGDTPHPDNRPGVVFHDSRRSPHAAGYNEHEQVWRQMPDRDGRPPLWVGMWVMDRPKPEDLAREQQLPGCYVRLADEQQWLIPAVREYDQAEGDFRSLLPAYVSMDDRGRVTRGRVVAAHRQLWEATLPLVDEKVLQGEHAEEAVLGGVVALLRANYRIDLPEIALGEFVVDDATIAAVAMVCSQARRFQEWVQQISDTDAEGEKKNRLSPPTPTGCDTSAGNGDSPPATVPPGATSGP